MLLTTARPAAIKAQVPGSGKPVTVSTMSSTFNELKAPAVQAKVTV